MGKSKLIIERVNLAIRYLKSDEFTIEDLHDLLKKKYPTWVPSMRALQRYLCWSDINAEKTGRQRQIPQDQEIVS